MGPIAVAGREPLWHRLDDLQDTHHDEEAGVGLGHQWAGEHLKLFHAETEWIW